MGYKYSKAELLAGAVDMATAEGLSGLTFGRLAKRLGVGDRIIVYYFPSKHDLISEVLVEMGARLQTVLAEAFTSAAPSHLVLARAAWPVLAQPDIDPTFRLFFEALGFAAAGHEPYRSVAGALLDGWAAWLEDFLDVDASVRRAEAEAAIALLDGLLLLRQVAGSAVADHAASQIFATGA